MTYLLDTCVLSEFTKISPNDCVVEWLQAQVESSCYLSVLTLGELILGIQRLPLFKKREKLEKWLKHNLLERFQGRIIPINEAVATRWGIIMAQASAKGTILPTIDSLLAATAQEYKLILVTRNIKDFQSVEIPLHNPWDDHRKT